MVLLKKDNVIKKIPKPKARIRVGGRPEMSNLRPNAPTAGPGTNSAASAPKMSLPDVGSESSSSRSSRRSRSSSRARSIAGSEAGDVNPVVDREEDPEGDPEGDGSSESKKSDDRVPNPYRYFGAQARRFKRKGEVGMSRQNALKTVGEAYPGLFNRDDKSQLLKFVAQDDVTDQDRAQVVFYYMMVGAYYKLAFKTAQNVDKVKAPKPYANRFDRRRYARTVNNPGPQETFRVDRETRKLLREAVLSFDPDSEWLDNDIDQLVSLLEESDAAGLAEGVGRSAERYMARLKVAVKVTSKTLKPRFDEKQEEWDATNGVAGSEDQASNAARSALLFALLQIAKDELAGSTKIKEGKIQAVQQNLGPDGDLTRIGTGGVNRDYVSFRRKQEESYSTPATVKTIKRAQERIRLNEPARRAKVEAGQEQSIESNREALGRNLDGVGAKYIFPAPTEPNTSTRPGQTCIANVDRESGLVIGQFKELKVVIPKGVLLGFTANSKPGQYLIYEYANDLDGFRQSISKSAYPEIHAEVNERKRVFREWQAQQGDKPNTAEVFAQGFYENRNEKYRRSLKGAGRKRQTFKLNVIQTASKRGELATTQVKAAKKRAKRKRNENMEENMDDNQGGPDFGPDGGGPGGPGGGPGGGGPGGEDKREKIRTRLPKDPLGLRAYNKKKGKKKKSDEQAQKDLINNRFTKAALLQVLEEMGIRSNSANPTKAELVELLYTSGRDYEIPPPTKRPRK